MPVNPWLEQKLQEKGAQSPVNVILELPTSQKEYARNVLSPIADITGVSDIAGRSFLSLTIDDSKIPVVSQLGTVHYNMPRGIAITTRTEDEEGKIGHSLPLQAYDPFIGEYGISRVESPANPLTFPLDSAKSSVSEYILIPTGKTVAAIKDSNLAKTFTGKNISLAVIDTGFLPSMSHPMIGFRPSNLYSTTEPPEPPMDGHSHGSWCSFAALGSPFIHPTLGKMEGVAPDAISTHIKGLSALGFGTTGGILKAIETAYNTGVQVVSMSLGGPAQGGVDEDPESTVISDLADKGMIFVIAAGNDGDDWTIGSPGICPKAITVGSQSFTDDDLAWFSSRGPSSQYYKDNPDEYEKDLKKYGDDLIKPDVLGYGGGRANKSDTPDEIIMSGGVGWMAPFYHKLIDGFAGMHGTSQATPAVAGLIACLKEAGLVNNVQDFKATLARKAKSPRSGYGVVRFSDFLPIGG